MNDKRFIADGNIVRDIEGKIPTILTYNKKELNEFLDGLNELNYENKILKKELEICKRDNKDLIEHISDISSQINVVVFSDHMRRYIPPKKG